MKTKAKHSLKDMEIISSPRSGPEAVKAMKQTVEALVLAYMTANLGFKDIPLKQLMDSCEKKILVGCLQLTHGSQKKTAATLGLKPTALFEKIRKHGIDIRQIKQFGKIDAPPPEENS